MTLHILKIIYSLYETKIEIAIMRLSINGYKIASFSEVPYMEPTNDNQFTPFLCNSEDDEIPSGLISFY